MWNVILESRYQSFINFISFWILDLWLLLTSLYYIWILQIKLSCFWGYMNLVYDNCRFLVKVRFLITINCICVTVFELRIETIFPLINQWNQEGNIDSCFNKRINKHEWKIRKRSTARKDKFCIFKYHEHCDVCKSSNY